MDYQPTPETLAIVERLRGTWHRRHAMVCCPAHNDSTPSLSIRQGRKTILVTCHAGCSGDNVMSAIRDIMGRPIRIETPTEQLPDRSTTAHLRIWEGTDGVAGTLGEVYLREVRGFNRLPRDVRFHPRCPKGKGRDAVFLPALIVGIFRLGSLCAIQRIFLDPHSGRRTQKMILGDSRGGTWPCRHPGTVMRVAEGFETAFAFEQITSLPAATCFGERNFDIFLTPLHIGSVVLLPDNHPPLSMELARAACDARSSSAAPATIHPCPPAFKDWAAILMPDQD